jgi:hypothetical protein
MLTNGSQSQFSGNIGSSDLAVDSLKLLLDAAAPVRQNAQTLESLEFTNLFATVGIADDLKKLLENFNPIEMDLFLYANRSRSKEIIAACANGLAGANGLSMTVSKEMCEINVSVFRSRKEIYRKNILESACERARDFLVRGEILFKQFGLESARPYYEAAIRTADVEADSLKVISEVVSLERMLRTGNYQDRYGRTQKLSQDQFISACSRIAAQAQTLKLPVECRFVFAHALVLAGFNGEAETLLRTAKIFADSIPVEKLRSVIAQITRHWNEFAESCQEHLFEIAVKLETTAAFPKDFRLGLCEFFLCGVVSEDAIVGIECFANRLDIARGLIDEASYNTVVQVGSKETGRLSYLQGLSELLSETDAA